MLAPQNSLAVQWIGHLISPMEGTGSIPSWETKIPRAGWCGQEKVDFFFRLIKLFINFFLLPLAERLSGDNSYENLTGITGLIWGGVLLSVLLEICEPMSSNMPLFLIIAKQFLAKQGLSWSLGPRGPGGGAALSSAPCHPSEPGSDVLTRFRFWPFSTLLSILSSEWAVKPFTFFCVQG